MHERSSGDSGVANHMLNALMKKGASPLLILVNNSLLTFLQQRFQALKTYFTAAEVPTSTKQPWKTFWNEYRFSKKAY